MPSDTPHVTRARGRYVPRGRVSPRGGVHQAGESWGAWPHATSKRGGSAGQPATVFGVLLWFSAGDPFGLVCVGMGLRWEAGGAPVYVVDASFRGGIEQVGRGGVGDGHVEGEGQGVVYGLQRRVSGSPLVVVLTGGPGPLLLFLACTRLIKFSPCLGS